MNAPLLFKHLKRGTQYCLLNAAELQCSKGAPAEGETLAIYVGTDDGKVWARPMGEFLEPDRFHSVDGTSMEFFRRQAEHLARFAQRHGVALDFTCRHANAARFHDDMAVVASNARAAGL